MNEKKVERKNVHPSTLIINQYSFPVEHDHEFERLLRDVSENGILAPIMVKAADEKGKYEILDGHRRWAVALNLDLPEVPIEIRCEKLPPSQEIAFISRVNCITRPSHPFMVASYLKKFFHSLDEEGSYSQVEKKQKAFKDFAFSSERSYYNYWNLSQLSDEILMIGQQGYLTRDQGLILYKGLKANKYNKIAENLICDLITVCASELSRKEKIACIMQRFKAFETALNRKEVGAYQRQVANKTLTANAMVKKMEKYWCDNLVIPNTRKGCEDLAGRIDSLIEKLSILKTQLRK